MQLKPLALIGLALLLACEQKEDKTDYVPPDLRIGTPLAVAVPAGSLGDGGARQGDLCADGRLYDGYLLHAFGGSQWQIDVRTRNGLDPVILVFGPWREHGQWGEIVVFDDDSGGDRDAAIHGHVFAETGEYLLLVASYRGDECGPYDVEARCLGGCEGPDGQHCPPLDKAGCGDSFCEFGHEVGPDGCPVCVCRAPSECPCDRPECPCPDGYECGPDRRCAPPLVCPPDVDLVCGDDGNTYRNRCEAETKRGVRVVHDGACRCPDAEPCDLACPLGYRRDDKGCPRCECQDECEACPRVGQPVCGSDGQTYPNACVAKRCADAEIVAHHACGLCPSNESCDLECPAGHQRDAVDCPMCACRPEEQPCGCPLPEELQRPVCGANGWTYLSECHARCENVAIVLRSACPLLRCLEHDGCPAGTACQRGRQPCPDGSTCPGACVMPALGCGISAAGTDAAQRPDGSPDADGERVEVAPDACPRGQECVDGRCRPRKGCDRLVDPVCANGITFLNACLAREHNAPVAHAGRCCPDECEHGCRTDQTGRVRCIEAPAADCNCARVYEPVCARQEDGHRRDFDNECLARCVSARLVSRGACAAARATPDDASSFESEPR